MLKNTITLLLLVFSLSSYAQSSSEVLAKASEHVANKEYKEAIEVLSEAIGEDKNNTSLLLKRGEVKYLSGKGILAIQDFNKVISIDAKNSMAYANRSAVYVDLKDYKSAIEDCQKAIEIDAKNELAYIRMGDSYFSMEDPNYIEAMKAYNYAINLNAKNKTALHNRGYAKKELKDYHGAIDDFNKAIIIDAEYGSAYMNRGICKSLLGDTRGACIDWYLAGEMGESEAADYIATRCNQ